MIRIARRVGEAGGLRVAALVAEGAFSLRMIGDNGLSNQHATLGEDLLQHPSGKTSRGLSSCWPGRREIDLDANSRPRRVCRMTSCGIPRSPSRGPRVKTAVCVQDAGSTSTVTCLSLNQDRRAAPVVGVRRQAAEVSRRIKRD